MSKCNVYLAEVKSRLEACRFPGRYASAVEMAALDEAKAHFGDHARTDVGVLLEMLDVVLGEVNLPGDINTTWHELDRLVPGKK